MDKYPETAKGALQMFEKGESITVIELGGLSEGYEYAIWSSIFEMIKYFLDNKLNIDDFIEEKDGKNRWKKVKGEEYSTLMDNVCLKVCSDQGLSGAQAEQIKVTTYQMLKFGWKNMMETAPSDRLIKIKVKQ